VTISVTDCRSAVANVKKIVSKDLVIACEMTIRASESGHIGNLNVLVMDNMGGQTLISVLELAKMGYNFLFLSRNLSIFLTL
jgi:hypothetical protein